MDKDAPRSAGFYDFIAWLDAHKRQVAIGTVVVAVVALGVGIWMWRSSERKIEAEEALASVSAAYNPLEPVKPGTADELAKIAAEYPNTQAAAKALLRAGTVYFAEGNYAKAREQFNNYLRSYGATPWVPEAFFGIAASLDAENKTAEAINQYKEYLAKYGTSPAADMARFNLARLYEQSNQPQLALETLTKMTNPQQPSSAMQEAQAKIRALLAKHPSLMPTNPTPPAPGAGQPQVLLPPQGETAPQIIVNPAQPTPGQPNPQMPAPAPAPVPTPAPAAPTPAPTPVEPAPAAPTPAK